MKKNKTIKNFGKKFKKKKSRFNHKKIKSLPSKKSKKIKYVSKYKKINYLEKIIVILFLIFLNIIIYYAYNNDIEENYGLSFEQKMNDYNTKKFAIFGRNDCSICGFFSFFIVLLGCSNKYLNKGYIPIIDLVDIKNIYNKGNKSMHNPWELFLYQINNYTLEEVKKYAKNISYVKCYSHNYRPNETFIYYDNNSKIFWHNFVKKYSPFKKEIMTEVKIKMKKLFGNSKNILGVLIRGTDYLKRQIDHPIPARVEQVIPDVKEFDRKYNYDFIYLATEDKNIKKKFMPEFENKAKYLEPDLHKKFNNEIEKFLNDVKNYIFAMIILSKCLDLIACRTSGAAAVFVLTEGFRHSKVYDFGVYK